MKKTFGNSYESLAMKTSSESFPDLKPCPHCGQKARLVQDTSSDYERNWSFLVECTNPNCGPYHEKSKDAIEWWNGRNDGYSSYGCL